MNKDQSVEVNDLRFGYPGATYGPDTIVLNGISLTVSTGELVCVVGPSGGGKTTLLRCIAGLNRPDHGTIRIGGMNIAGLSPLSVMLFQDLQLFDWLTVYENVEFALEARKIKRPVRQSGVIKWLKYVGMEEFSRYYPNELSGGMKQRVALARALAAESLVLLLDEPFSSLDVGTRHALEEQYVSICRQRCLTTICVTHDVQQAVFLADRVIVLSGRPCSIRDVISIQLADRNPLIRRTEPFLAFEDRVLGALGT